MKKCLLSLSFITLCFYPTFCQTLYSSTANAGYRFNPGSGAASTPQIVFDDLFIPSALVQGTDSVRVTNVKFGILRGAAAPAATLKFYYTVVDDTATAYNTLIAIPPKQIGSIDLPANPGAATAVLVSLGDSVNPLFSVKTDTGLIYSGAQTFFLGMSFSDPSGLNGWALSTPGAPEDENDDVMWIYDVDDNPVRYATYFGPTAPSATFYMEVSGFGYKLLPVNLSGFTARKSGSVNLLQWTTAQESNSSHFVVERSAGGQQFENIGEVEAAGNSSAKRTYNFADDKPLIGNNYYRIRAVDKDNASKLSDIKTVRNTAASAVGIYPNPAGAALSVKINSVQASTGYLSVADLSGKIVYSRSVKLAEGTTILPVALTNLAAGSYVMKIQLDDELIIKKFSKQ